MDIGTLDKWERRDMPSPIFLMKVAKSTSVSSQDLYYALMGMRKSDFDRADTAVKAMGCIRDSGMDALMQGDIDTACDAILHNRMDDRFDTAIKSMAEKLAYVGAAIVKAEKPEKEEKEDEPEEKPEEKPEPPEKDDAPAEEEVVVEDEPVEETEVAPDAPAPAPVISMGALLGESPAQVSIDPKLVMKALEMLQSIGAMC